MNFSMKLHSPVKLAAISAVTLLSAVGTFAQDNRSPAATALSGGILICALLIGLGIYVYIALAVQTIAEKTNTENTWLAWIPIANVILLLNIAKKPIWCIVSLQIPPVTFIILILFCLPSAAAPHNPITSAI